MSKKRSLKKYANGTGATGYLQDPADAMAEYDIMLAKAEQKAASNPWIPVTMMAGQLLSSAIGSGQIGAGKTAGATTTPATTAANGSSNANGNIEAEGGEILEAPGGQPVKLKGASHEQGGVDVNVPPGTLIFSDRIVKDGKTMAERKAARENKMKNLEDLLGHKDTAIVNTATRTKENLEREEAEDLRLQEMADTFANLTQQFAYGTGAYGVPPYGPNQLPPAPQADDWMGIPYDVPYPVTPDTYAIMNNNPVDPALAPEQGLAATEGYIPESYSLDTSTPKAAPGTPAKRGAVPTPTGGDIVGLIGNMVSTFGPLKNTLENRAGDTPNINAFKDFGKEALQANEDAQGYVQVQKDNAIQRIQDRARGSKRSARNSARGVNTMRALDLGIDMAANEADTGVADNFAQQMMQLLGAKSQLENVQDQVVMTGEQEKDLNNRKDRDNFYTQKGKDIATMGTGLQQTGKDINTILKNPVMLNLLNEMGKYFTVNAKGELEAKTTT